MSGMQPQQPKMSLADATKGAGLVYDDYSKMYYNPNSGQFYNAGAVQQQTNPLLGMIQSPMLMYGSFNRTNTQKTPSNALNYGGYQFLPFTGNRDGISQGLFSPIGRPEQMVTQYQQPANILQSLFGNIDFSGKGDQQSSGVARFLSGGTPK